MNGFHAIVLEVVQQIPSGQVATYGQVARLAGFPGYARHVSGALRKAPAELNIPWHRVVNAQGKLTYSSTQTGSHPQKIRLCAEGVEFLLSGNVDMKRFRWDGRSLR